MIPVPAPLDKYDTRARLVCSWVPTIRVPVGIEVSMGIVLKLGSDIDSVGVPSHWVNGRTIESLVKPHD
jgi:hypothetical protein